MSSKAASFVKFTVQEGKTDEFVAQLKPIVKEYSQLPDVLSCTFAQTGANEIRSCVVYDTMASLEARGPALKEAVAKILPLLAEGGFDRAIGEVFVEKSDDLY